MNIIEREKIKYNELHLKPKYGGKTGRVKVWSKSKDNFHANLKNIIKHCNTLLDVGCGKGAFIDLFKILYPHLKIKGVDIADEVKKVRPELDIDIASASDLPYDDNSFDMVCLMDGMEHIPVEIELGTLYELYRVSNQYIYHEIATHAVKHHDKEYEEKGLGAVHINLKTAEEWKTTLIDFCVFNDCQLLMFDEDEYWCRALIKK